jgi:outer membrane protein TolC
MGQYDRKNTEIAVPDINSNPIKIKEIKEEEILAQALVNRPVIKGQEALISVKEYEISIAKRERFPDLIVSYRRDSNREYEPEENGVVYRFALPVFDYVP